MSKIKNQLNPKDFHLQSIAKSFAEANQDSDAASFWHLGTIKTFKGAIVIIKGREATIKARDLLVANGLLTPNKPIIDPK